MMITEKIRLYADREDVTLSAYVLEDSPELLKGQNRPGILICPGGAYLSCTDKEAEPVAMAFAAMGYHAFVLRYSVYGEGRMVPFPELMKPLPVKSHCLFPNPMNEIGMALDLINEHAEAWKVDMEKICLCGFSAGAHNCAMYATHYSEIGIRPAAAVLGYALTDYEQMKLGAESPIAAALNRASNTAYLGTPEPDAEALRKVSPVHAVTKDTPPMFLWATAEDAMVSVSNTLDMAKALSANGVSVELHVFEKGDHGFSLASQASAGAKTQISKDAHKWVALCEEWLERRFALPLPEKEAF